MYTFKVVSGPIFPFSIHRQLLWRTVLHLGSAVLLSNPGAAHEPRGGQSCARLHNRVGGPLACTPLRPPGVSWPLAAPHHGSCRALAGLLKWCPCAVQMFVMHTQMFKIFSLIVLKHVLHNVTFGIVTCCMSNIKCFKNVLEKLG